MTSVVLLRRTSSAIWPLIRPLIDTFRGGVVLLAVLLVSGLTVTPSAVGQDAFITTWQTTSSGESITIPTNGGTGVTDYDFEINWGDGSALETITGNDPDPSHPYAAAGTYTVAITGTFPHFYLDDPLNSDPNADKLQSIEQWGDIQWESMNSAFAGAENMVYNATDAPDLSSVTTTRSMFRRADAFNGAIGGWDVSAVTDMSSMFNDAATFDQDIGGWDVSAVTDMGFMFRRADAFNGAIGEWDVSAVTNMRRMFDGADAFNGAIGGWDVSAVTDMRFMFDGADAFNGAIGEWDVSAVTDMRRMFTFATSFDQDIGGWDVSSVTNMRFMFLGATSFDQDIGGWDVSNVDAFGDSFGGFLEGAGLSAANYDALLIGWEQLDLVDGLSFDAGSSPYTSAAASARQAIINDDNWSISDGGLVQLSEPFITTWETTSSNESITIPTTGGAGVTDYDFEIDWGDGSALETITGDDPDPSHPYAAPGTYTVAITGTFPHLYLNGVFGDGANADKLQSIEQWGDIQWESMDSAFAGAENMVYNATDAPDLSAVTTMRSMFRRADAFNGAIGGWDVSAVTDMSRMFEGADAFNQDIGGWDVSGVTNMEVMFASADAFNQDIGGWDVSNVAAFGDSFGGFLEGAGLSAANYDALLIGWEQLDLVDGLSFDAGSSPYTSAAASARQAIINDDNWSISDGGLVQPSEPFITTWQTTSSGESITIPTNGGTGVTDYDFEINWGDGTPSRPSPATTPTPRTPTRRRAPTPWPSPGRFRTSI